MGCQNNVLLGQNLTFSVCTHDPDTGVLTDADAVPAYRLYESETATPILTGNMAKLDDANTTGFYTETVACTTANGFEINKSYTIYVTATVDSDTGGIPYSFGVGVPAGGPIEFDYTVTDADTGLPIADVVVWVTTDIAGLNTIAKETTDNSGVATFYLEAATYYVWRKKAGYSFTNPDQEIVS